MIATTHRENDEEAASSTMTKNEYQTDIHELIQKDPHQPQRVSEDINLAFDKCTLLSSQRSDAPAFSESHDPLPRLGNFTILSRRSYPVKSTGALRARSPPRSQASDPQCGSGVVEVVRCLRGARPSGLPLYPLGRTTRTLPGTHPAVESSTHPGRVAPHHPRNHADLERSARRASVDA